jgi:hypothetical protein
VPDQTRDDEAAEEEDLDYETTYDDVFASMHGADSATGHNATS